MHRLSGFLPLIMLAAILLPAGRAAATAAPTQHGNHGMPHVGHVFIIVLENEPYSITFGEHSPAPYLAQALPKRGALLPRYYAIGHNSLDNYIAMISGQAPNPQTQDDCPVMTEFTRTRPGLDAQGQAVGAGCVYPADVKTVAGQLVAAGLSWKGYMEDMGNDPKREAAACGHVPIGAKDITNLASPTDEYADKHDPFVYFHSIIDRHAYCEDHVVPLETLRHDLQHIGSTPNLAYITPGLCHDGHDAPCANGQPGGLVSANRFLKTWIPRITRSPAFRKNGLIVITFDEGADGTACCGEQGLPGGPPPGKYGPGGGRIGAVLLSPFIKPGTVSHKPYNHYSLLRSIEDNFGLKHLGYAAGRNVHAFGKDVFAAH